MSQQASATPSAKEGKHIFGWVFGIFFLLMALAMIFTSFISGLAMLILGLLLLPPFRQWFEQKINTKIPRVAALLIGIVLFVVAAVALPNKQQSSQVAQDTTKSTNATVDVVTNTNAVPVNTNTVANSNQTATTTNTPQNTNQPEPTPVVVEPVKEEPKPEPTTIDKLWIALDDSIKTRTGYDVQWDEENKTVWLTRTQDTFWDEKDLVEDTYTDFVKFGKLAFQIDGVDYIDISYQVPFTDEFGAETMKDAVGLQMKKETFEKFNWENLKYQPIYQTMQDNAEYQTIHPSIRKKIDESKLILSF